MTTPLLRRGAVAALAATVGSLALAAPGNPGTPPTLAEVQRAYAAAHPAPPDSCPDGTRYFSLEAVPSVTGCLVGDSNLGLQLGRATFDLDLEQYGSSYYHFKAQLGGRPAGTMLVDPYDGENPTAFTLLVGEALQARLPGPHELPFVQLADTTLLRVTRALLKTSRQPPAYYAAAALNDKGYALQRLGYQQPALLFFNEVLRRYPTRAVACLNRGDAYWALHQPAAAQADYRRYLTLLHTQHKDTTRVPAYVRLALRLPAGAVH